MKTRGLSFLLALGMALFFTANTTQAQARQQDRDCSRFTQCDRDGDGYIARNEFRNGSFADFDRNGDGQLSRKEYRKMNRSQKAYQSKQGQGNGKQVKGKGQGNGQRMNANGDCNGQGPRQQKGYRQGSGQPGNGATMQGRGRPGARRGRG